MSIAAGFLLSAMGRNDFKNADEYYESLVGAMLLIEGLSEIKKIRNLILGAMKKK